MAIVHVRVIPERGSWPAVAAGLRDVYGFGLFPASYVVGMKRVAIRGEGVRFHLGWGFKRWPSRVVGPSGGWTAGWSGGRWSRKGCYRSSTVLWGGLEELIGRCGTIFGGWWSMIRSGRTVRTLLPDMAIYMNAAPHPRDDAGRWWHTRERLMYVCSEVVTRAFSWVRCGIPPVETRSRDHGM